MLLVLAALTFCSRKPSETGQNNGSPPEQPAARSADEETAGGRAEESPGQVVSKREITLSRQQSNPEPQPDTPVIKQSEEQKLLSLYSGLVLPEDFNIGPLADLMASGKSEREIASVAGRFLEGLKEGKVIAETIDSNVREELDRSLQYYLEQGLVPRSYRLGSITMPPTEPSDEAQSQPKRAWMNIRLFGSPGVCEGELYLLATAGRWYISDLQINLDGLHQSYTREQEKYYPSIYGWGIQ